MFDLLRTIFTPGNFEPHIVHFIPNNMGLVWFMVAGNALIALSYTLIPAALLYLIRKRKDIMFTPIFWLFAAFILLCGLTHVMHIMIFWYPAYWLEGVVLAITGIVSIFTFFALLYVIPLGLKLKSPKQMEEINNKLSAEIENHKKTDEELKKKNQDFERINKEIIEKSGESEKMNKLMVDRELAMIELKKENEELKAKLSKM